MLDITKNTVKHSVYKLLFTIPLITSIGTMRAEVILSPAHINEWQFIDNNGMVFPWYTKPFLDVLITWNIKNWDVFEWGGGYSTVWWAAHAKHVVTVDNNEEWLTGVQKNLDQLNLHNVILKHRVTDSHADIGDGGQTSPYVLAIDEDDKLYDCIIIDGRHRNTCATKVLAHLKPGGILILDNANQASCDLNSLPTFELFKDYVHHSYLQPGHRDWRTDYWIIQ